MINMKELQGILDKERRELREVLGSAKAKIDQTVQEKKALAASLEESEATVRDQTVRIKELEDLLRQLRGELASGGSSMTAVASAVTFISGSSAVDEVFSRQWSQKTREEPAITVLEPVVMKLRSLFQSEEGCKSECSKLREEMSEAEARHQREILALQRRLDEEIASRMKMEAACNDSDARYQAVAAELAKNNQEIHSWRTEERLSMERALAELRAQLEAARTAIDDLTHDRSQRDQKIVTLEHEVETSKKRLVRSQTEVSNLEQESDRKTIEIENLAQELTSLKAKLAQLQSELEQQAERHSNEMNHERSLHETVVNRHTQQITQLEATINRLKAEIQRLEHTVAEAQNDADDARARASQLKQKLEQEADNHRTEKLRLQQEFDEELRDANETINELRREIDDLMARLKETAQQLAEAHAQLGSDRDSAAKVASTMKQLQLEIEQLRRELRQAQQELSESRQAIYTFKVATGFEKLELLLWTQSTIHFVSGFYQWRAEAHAGAMQRAADELGNIVGTVDTSQERQSELKAQIDDFNIEAFDVKGYAADFGL